MESMDDMLAPYIRLSVDNPKLRRQEWRSWKKLGYRVLAADGVTIYHEQEAIRLSMLEAFADLEVDIFLFGSRVRNTAHEKSDYDVGYYSDEKISPHTLADLKEKFEAMPIPARVDLVDFAAVDAEFVRIVLAGEVKIWKQKKQNSLFI